MRSDMACDFRSGEFGRHDAAMRWGVFRHRPFDEPIGSTPGALYGQETRQLWTGNACSRLSMLRICLNTESSVIVVSVIGAASVIRTPHEKDKKMPPMFRRLNRGGMEASSQPRIKRNLRAQQEGPLSAGLLVTNY